MSLLTTDYHTIIPYLLNIETVKIFSLVNHKTFNSVNTLPHTPYFQAKDVETEMKIFSNATTIICDPTNIPSTTQFLDIKSTNLPYPRCLLLQHQQQIKSITISMKQYNNGLWKQMPLEYFKLICIEELNGYKQSQTPEIFKELIQLPNCPCTIVCDSCQMQNITEWLPKEKNDIILEVHNGPITMFWKDTWYFGELGGSITIHHKDIDEFLKMSTYYMVDELVVFDFKTQDIPDSFDFSLQLPINRLSLKDMNVVSLNLPSTLQHLEISNCAIPSLHLTQSSLTSLSIVQCADLTNLHVESPLITLDIVYTNTAAGEIHINAKYIKLSDCYVLSNIHCNGKVIDISHCSPYASSSSKQIFNLSLLNAIDISISSCDNINSLEAPCCTHLTLQNNQLLSIIDATSVLDLKIIDTPVTKATFKQLKTFNVDNHHSQITEFLHPIGNLRLHDLILDTLPLQNFKSFSLYNVSITSLQINAVETLRLHNCTTLQSLNISKINSLIVSNSPVLTSVQLPHNLKSITILKCPQLHLSTLPTVNECFIDFLIESQKQQYLKLIKIQNSTFKVQSEQLHLEDIENSQIHITDNVKSINIIGCNNIKLIGLENSNVTSIDITCCQSMKLILPQMLTFLNVIQSNDVVFENITKLQYLPKQIIDDYSNQQFESAAPGECVIC
ncbi:Leucine-rich repeat containing protein [Entamoeba marina]